MSTLDKTTMKNLVVIPAVITLAITLLRLTGEFLNWSPLLFNKTAGGGGALIGIAWLVPILGFYFARRLMKLDIYPSGLGQLFGFAALGLAAFAVLFALAFQLPNGSLWQMLLVIAATVIGLFIARRAWPELYSVLFTYGLAARIPVVIVMFLAIMGSWGTHYDAPPPNLPSDIGPFARWIVTGLIPQLTIWMVFTVAIGLILGGVAVSVAARKPAMAKAVS